MVLISGVRRPRMRPRTLRAPQKPRQLLRHGLRRRLVESSGAAFDPRGFDAGDLRGPHHGWCGQARACEVGDRNVARPGRVVGAGDHRDPDQPEWRQLAIGNDQGRAALFGETVGGGERHHDDVEGVKVLQGFRHARPCAGHPRLTGIAAGKDVDGRDKPGHDGILLSAIRFLVGFRGPFRKCRERIVV
jgi:hypothetical protein